MNGLEGCYCERTCSVKGVIYREDEGWTDGCRNCTCSVGFRTREGGHHVSLHTRSLWTRFGLFRKKAASHYVCSNAAVAYVFAFVVIEAWKLLFFSLVHQMKVCAGVY